jgi:OOP family OmpA-OmpF porin
VCDGLDKCPGTPAGTKVDADGCAVVVERVIERFDPGTIQLTNVHFDFDKSTIRADGYAVLDSVGNVLTQWPGLNIEIDGHADSRGTDAYNLALSQRRAESVSAYLREHFPNFGAAQVTTKGYGESRPVAPNNSPANMQLNRRGEFVVLTKETLQREK